MSSEEDSPPEAPPPPAPEPEAGPSRNNRRLWSRLSAKAIREKKTRSLEIPREKIPFPFAGYYSESDDVPLNLARGRRCMRRRCFSKRKYFGHPEMGDLSPIGSEGEFRSYSSSRASSVQELARDVFELENDVFYDDEHQMRILEERLTWDNLLQYLKLEHLKSRFERVGMEIGDLFRMTFVDLRSIGIREIKDLAILRKVIMSYTDRRFDSF